MSFASIAEELLTMTRPLDHGPFLKRYVGLFAVLLVAASSGAAIADMPNRSLTPGDAVQHNVDVVCRVGEAHRERAVSYKTRDRVYASYGIPRGQRKGRYRIDHLIPLELGGSNRRTNLWPQSLADSRLKDRVEGELHHAVCSGTVPLDTAQRAIAKDWHTAVPAEIR